MDRRKLIKRLGILWLVALNVVWVLGYVYGFSRVMAGNDFVPPLWGPYHWAVLAFVFLFSMPVLLWIRCLAAREDMKVFTILSTIILIQHVFWVVLSFVMLFFPGT